VPGYHPHPETWALGAALLLGYMWAVGRHVPGSGRASVTRGQKVAFISGVVLLVAGEEWPLHDLAEGRLFSAHMVQHMLFVYVVPPLLLLGTPTWLARAVVGEGARRALYRFVTRPLVAFVLLNGGIAAMHWEPVVDLQIASALFHFVFHIVLLGAGVAMWAVVLDPLPEFARLTEPFKMMYLFIQSIIPTVPASFLTFSEGALYDTYAASPRVWSWLDAVADQRIAGLIMKVGGGLLLWAAIAIIFFKWNAAEERTKDIDTLSWDDFERELEVWDMRKR
jgi:putative membrane protein